MPSAKKQAGLRQGKSGKTVDVALRDESWEPPPAPRGLATATRKRWRAFWETKVSRACDPVADAYALERWIRAINELELVRPTFEEARLVKGSMGQPTLNPLGPYIQNLKAEIAKFETEFGLTPMARAKLGIAIGEERLTADELNRRLNRPPPTVLPAGDDERWEEEWEA